jgi:ectoine hydroxylase-related dioxygenase (phytanoyl-CoA dioxygenase family)
MLNDDDVSRYKERGFAGPFRALTVEQATQFAGTVSREVMGIDQSAVGPRVHCRHLDNRLVYDLCTVPSVLDRVESVLGPDVVLWRSNVWHKAPDAPAVAWHQDLTHWPLDPMINVSVWLALTEATVENGCVEVVPGSHHDVRRVEDEGRGDPFRETIVTTAADEESAVPMVLEPGEYFIFSEKLVHRSGINYSTAPRTGVVSRFTTPAVLVDHDRLLDGAHRNVVVRGEDRYGFNQLADPPAPSVRD